MSDDLQSGEKRQLIEQEADASSAKSSRNPSKVRSKSEEPRTSKSGDEQVSPSFSMMPPTIPDTANLMASHRLEQKVIRKIREVRDNDGMDEDFKALNFSPDEVQLNPAKQKELEDFLQKLMLTLHDWNLIITSAELKDPNPLKSYIDGIIFREEQAESDAENLPTIQNESRRRSRSPTPGAIPSRPPSQSSDGKKKPGN